jgi:hypothetical protein
MKSLCLLSLAALASGLASEARADFSCVATSDGKILKLYEPQPAITREYSAELVQGESFTFFKALPTLLQESSLYSKFEYKLWNAGGDHATLLITAAAKIGRGGCGRGDCVVGIGKYAKITGKLSHGGVETVFNCEETAL